MTDPIATLRVYSDATASADGLEALAELERRARIEARRDAWLAKDPWPGVDGDYRHVRHVKTDDGSHHVELWGSRRYGAYCGRGPDYHTALESALNAAGAP